MKDLSKQEMIDLLSETTEGVLAVTNGDVPYCIPIGHVCVGDTVFFSIFPKGRKWDYIQKIPKVCFTVFDWFDNKTRWASVVVDGEMEQIDDWETVEAVVRANMEKQGLDPDEYLEKRMDYYRRTEGKSNGVKIFRIKTSDMQGKTADVHS
jgi:nitroimidazol reductase NimA-like FMN-containing flavoprotein (pyridoxamine 5'-phosphate oxidase superfamily)